MRSASDIQHKPMCPRHLNVTLDFGPGWVTQSEVKPCTCGLDDVLAALARAEQQVGETEIAWHQESKQDQRYIAELLAQLARAEQTIREQPAEWQPIETAPKDGRQLLLGWPTMVMGGYWSEWQGRQAWTTSRGEYSGSHAPTHWMPTPDHPRSRPATGAPETSPTETEKKI